MLSMRRSALTLRRSWPFGLLLASLGLTSYAVFAAQRAESSSAAVGDRTVRDYSAFAGWSYAQHLQESMRAIAREVLGPVNHGGMLHMAPGVPDASDLAHYLPYYETCHCHRPRTGPIPETFFAFRIGDKRLLPAINTHPMPKEGWEIDRLMVSPVPAYAFTGYSEPDNALVVDRVTHMARDYPDREHGYSYLVAPLSIGPRLVGYTLMPTSRGDTMVYGVQYNGEGVRSILRDVYDNSALLPDALVAGRRNRDLVDIVITDEGDNRIFSPTATDPRQLETVTPLGQRFANLKVRAGIRPEYAGSLVVGGLPSSKLPFLFGLLAVAAALTIVAVVQLRREAELSGMRSNWISSVSHELRTPLAQIRLYVDTVRLGRATEPAQRDWALAKVDRETTRLHHLVENVLRFSQLGKANGVVGRATDMTAETQQIVDEFRPLVEARRISIDTRLAAVPPLALKPDSLRHILLNLLDNAVKYGPDGQTITVSLAATMNDVQLVVADQGRGVATSEREEIWRAFSRGHAGQDTTGSGIGLSIVRDVVVQHGGRAWVDAAPGGGARFTVSLPLSLATA
jgi:signal transduction histidine kinase